MGQFFISFRGFWSIDQWDVGGRQRIAGSRLRSQASNWRAGSYSQVNKAPISTSPRAAGTRLYRNRTARVVPLPRPRASLKRIVVIASRAVGALGAHLVPAANAFHIEAPSIPIWSIHTETPAARRRSTKSKTSTSTPDGHGRTGTPRASIADSGRNAWTGS